MPRYRVLSLDGGGIRGLLSSRILERIEGIAPGFIESVHLIGGTSTGGILALGLAAGMRPAEISDLYVTEGPAIFKPDIWDDLGNVDRFVHADYTNEPLKEALQKRFGDLRLRDLGKRVVVSTFDLDGGSVKEPRRWRPKFFHNFDNSEDAGMSVVDVAMATSAAPSFFPIFKGFVDGGVIANNPSMCALAQALDWQTGQQDPADVALLSVGTGQNPKVVEAYNQSWGLLEWAPHLLGILLGGPSDVPNYQCRQILGTRYLRLDPQLDDDIALDDCDSIELLESVAEEFDLEKLSAPKWLRSIYLAEPAKQLPSAARAFAEM